MNNYLKFALIFLSFALNSFSQIRYQPHAKAHTHVDSVNAGFVNNMNRDINYFISHDVTDEADGAYSIYAIDIDNDEDIDILSASIGDDKISWYENDGNEYFISHDIANDADGACSVFASDMDGDHDIDIVSGDSHNIVLYKNNGEENFESHIIYSNEEYSHRIVVFVVDLDEDGDNDIVGANYNEYTIEWFENDGEANFVEHSIVTGLGQPTSIYVTDFDNDKDFDVLAASRWEHKVVWFENDGNENFIMHEIASDIRYAIPVYSIDIDDDGDQDVLSASSWNNTVFWFENDGNQSFTEHVISDSADYAFSVHASDIDLDGDIDVLSASSYDNKIALYENDGNENFSTNIISSDAYGAKSVFALDLDRDTDTDIISASSDDDKIAWYENMIISDKNRETDILSFGLDEQINSAIIDLNLHTVIIEIEQGSDLTSLVSTFALSDGATAYINSIIQESGVTVNDFSNPVTYTIVAEDGKTVHEWLVTVNLAIGVAINSVQQVNVFPNPFSNKMTIEFNNPDNSEYILSFYNISGQKLKEINSITKNRIEFERDNLPEGIYIIELCGKNIFRATVMIQ